MDWLMQIEIAITLFFQNLGSWLEIPMQIFTFFGNELFFLLVMPALYWSIDPVIGFRAGMMLILSGGINSCLKMVFRGPRPFWVDSRVKAMTSEISFGIPSGHSQNSVAIWGVIAASLRKKWFWIVTLTIIFMIGLSRIYLGVHFVRDVLSGWLLGGIIVFLYMKLEKPFSKWLTERSLSLQLVLAFLFSMLFIALGFLIQTVSIVHRVPQTWIDQAVAAGGETPNPFSLEGIITIAGVAFGFLAGYAWWRHKFGPIMGLKASTWKRLVRYILGLLGIVVLYFGLKLVFPEEPALVGGLFRYIRYALIGLWVTALAPLIFKSLHLE